MASSAEINSAYSLVFSNRSGNGERLNVHAIARSNVLISFDKVYFLHFREGDRWSAVQREGGKEREKVLFMARS